MVSSSSYIKNNNYEKEVVLAFIVGTCLVFTIVLCYIFRSWWNVRSRKDVPEETEMVCDYVRDIFCLPPNFRAERTEPDGISEEVVTEIVTSC